MTLSFTSAIKRTRSPRSAPDRFKGNEMSLTLSSKELMGILLSCSLSSAFLAWTICSRMVAKLYSSRS